jgi:hypothetical protein
MWYSMIDQGVIRGLSLGIETEGVLRAMSRSG